ncbi:MAG: hypothetical protein KF746_23705 [Chitinophagaceae bacterium]|nr:hypothetical protein [Chitinophagaceae bacterium]
MLVVLDQDKEEVVRLNREEGWWKCETIFFVKDKTILTSVYKSYPFVSRVTIKDQWLSRKISLHKKASVYIFGIDGKVFFIRRNFLNPIYTLYNSLEKEIGFLSSRDKFKLQAAPDNYEILLKEQSENSFYFLLFFLIVFPPYTTS